MSYPLSVHGIVGLHGCDHCSGEQFLHRAGRKAAHQEKVEEYLQTGAGWTICIQIFTAAVAVYHVGLGYCVIVRICLLLDSLPLNLFALL